MRCSGWRGFEEEVEVVRNLGAFVLFYCISVAASLLGVASELGDLHVVAGFDGANPQSQDAISQEAPDRFRVRPFNEEGSTDSYYFRFNTKIVNQSNETLEVELIIEWPLLAQYPDYNYDTYYYGDIGDWKWTYANQEGIEARLRIPVAPGETYVTFFPRYSYGQMEAYLAGLPESPYVDKWVEGASQLGRNIWVVKLTDPSEPDGGKHRIFVNGRLHPYETGGTYISEAIINYLLTDDPDAARIRRNNIVYVMPMLSPDGVVLGLNELNRPNGIDVIRPGGSGADISEAIPLDEPEVRTMVEFVLRVKPDIWLDIHSWPHQGDDGMWYITDEWVARGLLGQMPDGTFQGYVWNVWKATERPVPTNNVWSWVTKKRITAGAVPSISWFRRSAEDIRAIGRAMIKALAYTLEHKEELSR